MNLLSKQKDVLLSPIDTCLNVVCQIKLVDRRELGKQAVLYLQISRFLFSSEDHTTRQPVGYLDLERKRKHPRRTERIGELLDYPREETDWLCAPVLRVVNFLSSLSVV